MSTFEKAFEKIIGLEGGYVNDSSDLGGETKFGISKRTYPHLDIASITLEDAKAIYLRDWWMAYNYDRLQCEEVAIKTFDHSINMGAKNGHKLLQRACRACGQYTKDDGLIGPHTIMAANSCNSKQLISAMKSEAAGLYRLFIYARKENQKFEKGWLRRAYEDRR